MRREVRAVMILAVTTGMACAAPSRRLSTRVVEDPIVLPARLASAGLAGLWTHYEPTGERTSGALAGFRYGITDRLEWTDLLSLRYAFLDDRPPDRRPARALSLAVRAGLRGGGYSSSMGWILLPVASVDTLKRISDRWAVTFSAGWDAVWAQRRGVVFPSSMSSPGLASHRQMLFSLRATATRQLGDHLALGVLVTGGQEAGCADGCSFVARGASGGLTLALRPWHWLTLTASAVGGIRVRDDAITLVRPDGPVVITPRQVEYARLYGSVAFFW